MQKWISYLLLVWTENAVYLGCDSQESTVFLYVDHYMFEQLFALNIFDFPNMGSLYRTLWHFLNRCSARIYFFK